MQEATSGRRRPAKQSIHLPTSTQTLGAGPRRAFIVDAVGRKLSAPMPITLARHRATRINIEVPAGRSNRYTAAGATGALISPAKAAPAPAAEAADLGDIRTSSNPYLVSASLPVGLSATALDASWAGLIDRLASAIERQQVVMQQDADLRADQVMNLAKGFHVGTTDNAGRHVVAVIIDPYRYGAHQLRADSGRIRDAVRVALSGAVQP